MSLPFAVVDDLADWLGESITDPVEVKRAEFVLSVASTLVRTETGREWVDSSGSLVSPLPDALKQVTVMAAARAYLNPDGIEDVSEGLDDYTVRERRRVQDAGVYLTSAERMMLAGLDRPRFRGLGTVSTTRGDYGPCNCFPAVNSNWSPGECSC